MRGFRQAATAVAAANVLIVAACSEEGVTSLEEGGPDTTSAFLVGLPSWSTFAPLGVEQDPAATAAPTSLPDTVVTDTIADDGSTRVPIPPVTYECTATPYHMARTPNELVMYSPDVDLLWPGALIQGRSHRDPVGSLLALTIAQRTPIRVSIPEIPGGDNFREVSSPSQATVASAISVMVGNATTADLATPSSISYEKLIASSASQFALAAGISGKYLGFSAAASGGYALAKNESSVSVHFVEKMFTALVEPPQTPDAFFSEEFTNEVLQQQIDQGNIGPDNIPVYVSKVVYGRMMIFTLIAEASAQEISAAVDAAYRTGLANVEASLRTRYQKVLQTARVTVQTLGGPSAAALEVIRTGDQSRYFDAAPELSTAVPLSYEFRGLGGGNPVASVTETTDYVIRECRAEAATPGTFNLRPRQETALPFVPDSVFIADVNGDGLDDLLVNELSTQNRIAVAYGDGEGRFTAGAAITHPATPSEGWANFDALTGDFNGDGLADLAWSHQGDDIEYTSPTSVLFDTLEVYLALAEAGGSYSFPDKLEHPDGRGREWSAYEFVTIDANGDGHDDLAWFSGDYSGTALSTGDGGFDFLAPAEANSPAGATVALAPARDGRDGLGPHIGQLDGTGAEEVILANWGESFVLSADDDGRYTGWVESNGPLSGTSESWSGSDFWVFLADVDNRDGEDIVWLAPGETTSSGATEIWTGFANASGFFSGWTAHVPSDSDPEVNEGPFVARTGDFNGDGRADIVWNTLSGAVNRSFVGLGLSDGSFDFSPQRQLHPATESWSPFELRTGDFDGDGRRDVLWIRPGLSTVVYAGLGRS